MMQKEFILLAETLKQRCHGKRVFYIANPGNLGDALIRYGTLKFLRDINIKFTELNPKKMKWLFPSIRKSIAIYGGGGAWCRLWNDSQKYVDQLRRKFEVIVLPSTYESTYSIPNTIFFCRDRYESKQNMPEAKFCHDMAFYAGNISSLKGEGIGYFFRTDKETLNKFEIPANNNDLSLKGGHYGDIYPFIDEIAKYAVVHTDRLHIAITSCLLNKRVHLYPGAYFKNKAVYLSSIKDYFSEAYFHEEFVL